MRTKAIALFVSLVTMTVAFAAIPAKVSALTTVYTAAPTAEDYTCETVGGVAQVQYAANSMIAIEPSFPYGYSIVKSSYGNNPEWVATGLYNSTTHYYDIPQNSYILPPENSTIQWVTMIAIVCVDSGSRTFQLEYAINETKATIDAGTATWHLGDPADGIVKTTSDLFPNYKTYLNYITANESWNASMLRDNVWVRLWSDDEGTINLYVDYVGLIYGWTYGENTTSGQTQDVGIWGFDIGAGLSLVGFLGMIATPPLAIIAWKKEGGDRMRAFVMLITAWMFCFFMFYASIS